MNIISSAGPLLAEVYDVDTEPCQDVVDFLEVIIFTKLGFYCSQGRGCDLLSEAILEARIADASPRT
jgi:hypothetical protein